MRERQDRRARRLSFAIAAAVSCLVAHATILTAPATAQVLYGSIVGLVTDPQGAAVPGVTVTIRNKDTNLTRETTTDEAGNYSLVNLLPGTYDVKAALQGFREALRSSVPVTVGQISRVDLTLQLGVLSETVTVQSHAGLLQTDKADVSTDLKSTEIASLPLNQYRTIRPWSISSPARPPWRSRTPRPIRRSSR